MKEDDIIKYLKLLFEENTKSGITLEVTDYAYFLGRSTFRI